MAAYAEKADVEGRYRTLTGQPASNVVQWLEDATSYLQGEIPGIDARVESDTAYAARVRAVCCWMVIRVLRGQDPRDAADYSTLFLSASERKYLTGSTDADGTASGLPRGRFPAPKPWPLPVEPVGCQ